MKSQKRLKKLNTVLNDFYTAPEGSTSLENENYLVCFFGSILMLVGSICSFLSLHYFMNIDIAEIWFSSLVMFIMGIMVVLIPSVLKNEVVKSFVVIVIYSAYLIFSALVYYPYIGPAVFTIGIILMVISLLYKDNRMLLTILIITILVAEYFTYNDVEFNNWSVFYQAEMVTLLILSLVIITIQRINRRRAETLNNQFNAITKSEEKLKLTLESVGDGVITIDQHSKIEFMNPIAEALTGWHNQQAIGEPFEKVFKIVNEYTRESAPDPVKLVFETKKIVQLANHTLLMSRDGTERAIEDTAAPIKNANEHIIGCVLVFRDFSEKKEKQRLIEYLSYHDQLTGLYNRRYFEEELKRINTKRNLPLSIVYADVNGLKMVNDAFGHESGDALIRCVADVFKNECRADDIMARIGGDEFVLLFPGTDNESTEILVKRIKEKIEERKIMNINVSISFGWDTKHEENQSVMAVLKNAEDYMYQKKMLNSSSRRNSIIQSILNALQIKSSWEEVHTKRVGLICEDIGKAYHLNADEIQTLRAAGELHDIGMITVDEAIIEKTGTLTNAEWSEIRRHPETGYRLLSSTAEFNYIAEYIFEHHERWDGTGYPRGLKGESIQWKARVIAIADAYDAMTNNRSYRKALSEAAAVDEVKKHAGTQFDPEIARIFIEKVLGYKW